MSIYDDVDKLLLKPGTVGIMPTDTVYGLVCRAEDVTAVRRLYALKNRKNKPGTVIAASIDQLVGLGIKYRYLKAVEQFWPGPVSVEIPHSKSYLNQNTLRQAFRTTNNRVLAQLLIKTGPLLTSSANLPDMPISDNIEQARKYFGNRVDFYVDGGDFGDRLPSTIIRIVDDTIEVVREGAVKL